MRIAPLLQTTSHCCQGNDEFAKSYTRAQGQGGEDGKDLKQLEISLACQNMHAINWIRSASHKIIFSSR